MEIRNILKASGTKILFIGTPHLMKRLDELEVSEGMDEDLPLISFCRESQNIPDKVLSWESFLQKETNSSKTDIKTVQAPVDFGNLATIRYTSGTTGNPKGVTFNHEHL